MNNDSVLRKETKSKTYYTWNTEDKKYQGKEHSTYNDCLKEAEDVLINKYKSIFIEVYEYFDVEQILYEAFDYYEFTSILEYIEKKIKEDYETDWSIYNSNIFSNNDIFYKFYTNFLNMFIKFLTKTDNLLKIKKILYIKEIKIGG